MSQVPTSETRQAVMLRAFLKDQDRIDALIPKLENERGGSWSRAHVIELALDTLESKRAETPA